MFRNSSSLPSRASWIHFTSILSIFTLILSCRPHNGHPSGLPPFVTARHSFTSRASWIQSTSILLISTLMLSCRLHYGHPIGLPPLYFRIRRLLFLLFSTHATCPASYWQSDGRRDFWSSLNDTGWAGIRIASLRCQTWVACIWLISRCAILMRDAGLGRRSASRPGRFTLPLSTH